MKKITTLIAVILLLSVSLSAQNKKYDKNWGDPKNSMHIGLNAAFFGSKNIGHTVGAGYSYSITDVWALSGRVMTGWGRKFSKSDNAGQSPNSLMTTFSGALIVGATPWADKADWLSFEAGLLYQNNAQAKGNNTDHSVKFSKNNLFGLIYSVNVRIYQNKSIQFGVRGDMLTSFFRGYNIDALQAGLYCGVRF